MCCVLVVNVLMDSLVGCAAAWTFTAVSDVCHWLLVSRDDSHWCKKIPCVPCALICVCLPCVPGVTRGTQVFRLSSLRGLPGHCVYTVSLFFCLRLVGGLRDDLHSVKNSYVTRAPYSVCYPALPEALRHSGLRVLLAFTCRHGSVLELSPCSSLCMCGWFRAADQFEVLHVSVCCTRWLSLTGRASQSICHDRPILGPAR